MLRKFLSLILIVVLLISVGVVLAEEDEGETDHGLKVIRSEDEVPFVMFADGRLNANDVDAPVVIFYKYEPRPVIGADGNQAWDHRNHLIWEDELVAIEVLRVQPTGAVDLALRANLDDIEKVVNAAEGEDCCVMENGPISLHYSQSGWFWVEAPKPDGKLYTFQWEGFER